MTELSQRIRVVTGDITQLVDVDAIVTAANEGLLGGGGVDGAVHNAAGPELLAACRAVAPCPAGYARITPGFKLVARHVIHAVGPIYRGGQAGETQLLALTYQASLQLAADSELRRLAFPCISTGAYGFPAEKACLIAVETVVDWCRAHEFPQRITFCCFDQRDEALYQDCLSELKEISN